MKSLRVLPPASFLCVLATAFLLPIITGAVAAPAKKSVIAAKRPAVKRKPGFVVGQCKNAAGKALRGVRVRVFGTTQAGERTNYETRTDANGVYAVRLPKGNFHVGWALYDVAAPAGPSYSLPLHPVDGSIDDAPSTPGIVENFILKISGRISPLKDSENELSYYGGSIRVSGGALANGNFMDGYSYRFPEDASIELTLVPQGVLADGSAGKTLTRLKSVRNGTTFFDVPIGQYKVTANLIEAGGKRTPLRVAVARVGSGTSPVRFTPAAEDFSTSGKVYFPSTGNSTPLLTLPGVAYSDVYVQP